MAAAAKIGVKVMTIVIGIPVGMVTKKVVERVWLTARPENPPRKPSESGVQWADAIGWAALSAAGIVVADLVTRRGAEAAFKALTGSAPPATKPSRDRKALGKASKKSKATAD
jgi:hypothetical protein